jgi:hypothetical protein
MKFSAAALLIACASAVTLSASSGRPVEVATRARGAQRIVIGTVSDVQARFDVNEHGDQLIVSRVWLDVSETLKGQAQSVVGVDVEGGTVGELTLNVSDMPTLKRGRRAVFFLDSTPSGIQKPHLRGMGIMMLDAAGQVENMSLSLRDVKALIQSALR